ncbi:MAG: S-layer homology domain-containing protein [Thermincolia bacterium]
MEKKKKKLLVLLVLSVFLVNIFGVGVAGAGQNNGQTTVTIGPDGKVTITMQFYDIESAAWALKDISKMYSQDIIKGYKDGTFRPNNVIKRQEAVAMAIRLMGLEKDVVNKSVYQSVYGSAYLPFEDSKQIENWAKGYVALALEKKIIDASNGKFQPEKPATRLWVAVLLTKALGLQAEADAKKNIQLNFRDAGVIPSELTGYVAIAVEKGLVKGFPNSTFQPNKPVTRAEMAALLGRTDDQLPIFDKKKAKGIVTAVDLVASTITVKKDTVNTTVYGTMNGDTFPVDPDAKIFIADERADLADVKVGSNAQLRLKDGVVIFIEVKAQEAEGIVVAKSVYSLTVKGEEDDDDDDDKITGEIKVTPDTRIFMKGNKNMTFDNILVGDKIEAKVVNGEAVIIEIEGKKFEHKKDKDDDDDEDEDDEDDDEDDEKHKKHRESGKDKNKKNR